MHKHSRPIISLLIGVIAFVVLSNGASPPGMSTAIAAAPTPTPPPSTVEQALRDSYARNTPTRPISGYQEVGVINEKSTRLVLFMYRVGDRRADTSNVDGSPHWEAVVGSGVARLNAQGEVSALSIGEDGEEQRIKNSVDAYMLLPSDATAPATIAGIVWNTTAPLELRATKTFSLAALSHSRPAVFVWSGPQATVHCGFQIAVGREVKRTVDRSWQPNGDGTDRVRKECVGVAPFYHQATNTR